MFTAKSVLTVLLFSLVLLLSGCATLMSSVTAQMADDLSATILNSDDPSTVEQGVPAYLLMIDSFLRSSPDNTSLLMAASNLNGSFVLFVSEERSKLLTKKSLTYAIKAVCLEIKSLCRPSEIPYEEFTKKVRQVKADDLPLIYTLGVAWFGWIQSYSDDWNAVAQLSRARILMEQVIFLDEAYEKGNAQLYMGGLETLLPATLGGKPEKGRQHFEKALELSQGKNLMVKVIYADRYAKLVFDKELHDRLLKEALASDAQVEGMTLVNTLAQQQAQRMLSESDDYF